jgi:hypothetical protein
MLRHCQFRAKPGVFVAKTLWPVNTMELGGLLPTVPLLFAGN